MSAPTWLVGMRSTRLSRGDGMTWDCTTGVALCAASSAITLGALPVISGLGARATPAGWATATSGASGFICHEAICSADARGATRLTAQLSPCARDNPRVWGAWLSRADRCGRGGGRESVGLRACAGTGGGAEAGSRELAALAAVDGRGSVRSRLMTASPCNRHFRDRCRTAQGPTVGPRSRGTRRAGLRLPHPPLPAGQALCVSR